MRVENMQLDLAPLNLQQIRIDRCLHGFREKGKFHLNDAQIEFLELLSRGLTLRQIADQYFTKGIFMSFEALRQLLEFLSIEGLVRSPEARAHLFPPSDEPAGLVENFMNKIFGVAEAPVKVKKELKKLPFFRSLNQDVFDLLLSSARVIEAPRKTMICKTGQAHRSLYVLLRGRAAVYGRNNQGRRQKLAALAKGSVFGEAGFFLGLARSADVITDQESLILEIDYHAETFDRLIQMEAAAPIQRRFWVIHALLHSELFRDIPSDCFDALVFSGQMRKFDSGTWLCREGEEGTTCHVIVQGSAVVSQSREGLRKLGQGDCFGEIALILTNGRRSASVHSETEVLSLEIEAADFYKLLSENFALACKFENLALARLREDQRRNSA